MIERFENFAFTVSLDSHVANFTVVRADEHEGQTYYLGESGELMDDFAKAEVVLDGCVKWDGCSNWDYRTDQCMAHYCDRDGALALGCLIAHLWDITAARLPTWYTP